MEYITIDTRELEHPKPLEKILSTLSMVNRDRSILMIHKKEPLMLYDILKSRGYSYSAKNIEPNLWHITISKED